MDIADIFIYLIGLGLLLAFSSFFSGSETALTALTKTQIQRLREDRKRSSRAIIHFLDEPRRLFITVLFGNTLVNMAFVSITGMLIYTNLFKGRNPGLAYVVAILLQTLFLLIFGEITPKTYAVNRSEKFARAVAQPLWFFSHLIFPFRKAIRYFTDILLPLFGVCSMHEQTPLTSDEIKVIIKKTEEQGALDVEEGEIIHNIFELHDIYAKEAMVPRTEMVCVDVSKTIQDAYNITKDLGYSRLPVYRKNVDNICGIFYIKDLPRWKGVNVESLEARSIEELTIEEFLSKSDLLRKLNPNNENTLIRPPFFTIETKRIGTLMIEMTRERQQMAILVDEFGGVIGLITTEDIVEEVLGEIFDEYDKVSELSITRNPKDPSSVLIPGFVSLRSVNKRLKLKLDLSTADTIGGYVVSLFGRIPSEGEVVTDTTGLKFEVIKMDGTRVVLVGARLNDGKLKRNKKHGKFSLFLFFLWFAPLMGAAEVSTVPQGSWFPIFAFSCLLIVSLLLIAFYAGSETAVVSASKARIDVLVHQEDSRALIIKRLWREPDKMLGIVLVGTNLMSTAAGVAGLRLVSYAFPGRESIQGIVNTIIMTLFILVFCEILPKTVFRAKADSLALRSAPGLWISGILLRPFVTVITKITNLMVWISDREEKEERMRRMREELKLLAKLGEKEGALKREQLQMIHNVLNLETTTIEKMMTPLIDVVALPKKTNIDEFYRTVSKTGFSRIPVYEDRVDNLIGLVNVLDVLYSESPGTTIGPFIREDIRHEPESKRVYSLLRELKSSRDTMVFVVDEYGGIIGLVTIEDLIEEILGDIRDEKDREEEGVIHHISDNVIECDGKAEIQWINNTYDMPIPLGDYNTIAGYLIFMLERIPKRGESVETEMFKLIVLDADSKSIRRVRIIKK